MDFVLRGNHNKNAISTFEENLSQLNGVQFPLLSCAMLCCLSC